MTARATATTRKSATAPDVTSAESFARKLPPLERILTTRKAPIKNHGRFLKVSHPNLIMLPGENVFIPLEVGRGLSNRTRLFYLNNTQPSIESRLRASATSNGIHMTTLT